MEKIETSIEGCYELRPRIFEDSRGRLVKTFHENTFESLNLSTRIAEEYYSFSRKGVLRGLHFQLPPHDHIKCVTCISGSIFDVVVDLRKSSKTFGQHFSLELNSSIGNMLYIPAGLAHGFYVLSEEAVFLNRTSTVYNGESDAGIKWDSCGIAWPDNNPILSEKDKNMTEFSDFSSPF